MFKKRLLKFFKRPLGIVVGIVVLLVAFLVIRAVTKTAPLPYEFVVAARGNLIQEVSVTGRVKPAESVSLAFEKTGTVAHVYADVGDRVAAGTTLVALNGSEAAAQLSQAEAALLKDSAKLDELKQGTRPEEIQVQEVKVANANVALDDAKKNLVDKLQDAYTKSDDAVRNRVDQFFSSPESSSPKLSSLIQAGSELKAAVEQERLLLTGTLASWKTSLAALSVASDFQTYVAEASTNLNDVKTFLDNAAQVVNSLTPYASLSQTTIDTWKGDVATGRTNVNTAIVNLTAANEKYKSAVSSLDLAEQELALDKAGTVEEQIAAQEAQVKESEANVAYYRAQLAKTTIRAPFSGIVTIQDAKVGQTATAGSALVSLISDDAFKIEVNVPEADIAKLTLGNSASVTLDAYGRDVEFQASVTEIDPAETIIEGVSTYKVTLQFAEHDPRVKSGMTAKIIISTDKRENVIAIPQRAVVRSGGETYVRIVHGETIDNVPVETGLRGSDGNVEIIQGVAEGDKVVTFSESELQ